MTERTNEWQKDRQTRKVKKNRSLKLSARETKTAVVVVVAAAAAAASLHVARKHMFTVWTIFIINVKKLQFNHVLTTTCIDWHIENSKNDKKGDISHHHIE